MAVVRETEAARSPAGVGRVAERPCRSRVLGAVVVGLAVLCTGCGVTSTEAGGPTTDPAVAPSQVASVSRTDEQVCDAVTTALFLVVERVMVVAVPAPPAEQEAVEQAYIEARRAVPAELRAALAEVEQVYDRLGSEYLDLLAAVRRGERHDRAEVLEVFESRRPALREIVARTGLDDSCERLARRTNHADAVTHH